MRNSKLSSWAIACVVMASSAFIAQPRTGEPRMVEEFLTTRDQIGRCGGRLVISQRAEPKTLNPVLAMDGSSRDILGLINADLIHINRLTQKTEPALATSWNVAANGLRYTLHLRRGVLFSDGRPFDADDVLFSFQVYLDERIHSSQRDLLVISGKPIRLQKIDAYTVSFELEQPYAAAERLFDGIAILPRHLLQHAYTQAQLNGQWSLSTAPGQIAGLGPFQLKQYVPGQHITLTRNQNYWKKDVAGNRLPYLDEIVSVFTGNADAEAMRFEAGELDVVNRLSAANFAVLERHQPTRHFRLYDSGASLEYSFLFFNLNELHSSSRQQAWFRELAFRKAVSAAVDREAIVRLVYHGRASSLSTNVTPGNKLWLNTAVPRPLSSAARARQILKEAGFSWDANDRLLDSAGNGVSFSVIFNAGNPQHAEAATLIQFDLKQTGMDVKLVPLEYHALLDRIFKSYDYEAAIIALLSGDADPNSEMNIWTTGGSAHVWDLTASKSQRPWESEVDRLMKQQMITLDEDRRKKLYNRVQQIVSENLPIICLVSPNVLVGAADHIGNFHPANLSNYTLWNVEQLYWRP